MSAIPLRSTRTGLRNCTATGVGPRVLEQLEHKPGCTRYTQDQPTQTKQRNPPTPPNPHRPAQLHSNRGWTVSGRTTREQARTHSISGPTNPDQAAQSPYTAQPAPACAITQQPGLDRKWSNNEGTNLDALDFRANQPRPSSAGAGASGLNRGYNRNVDDVIH